MKTLTLNTADHGTVTFPEPAWCTRGSHHGAQGDPPRRSEISHQGDPFHVTVSTPAGEAVLFELALWQDAFPEPHWPLGDQVHAIAELAGDRLLNLRVPDLDAFADAMRDAGRQIQQFADHLALTQPRGGAQ